MTQVTENFTTAQISQEEKLMLQYAEQLTKQPFSVQETDIKGLRKAGYSDRDIFDINQVVSYFNYVNRIADGLGVVLENK